jgi:chromosome segregation and condensation protein ScpB
MVGIPLPPPTSPVQRRVYKRGTLSKKAEEILAYINSHSGIRLSKLQEILQVSCMHRYVSCLHEDQLIDVSEHPINTGRPIKRCWIKGELNGK